MVAKAWFKLVNPESEWGKVSLEGIEYVAQIKRAIKAEMDFQLSCHPTPGLSIKATKEEDKDSSHAVELDAREDLKSVLGRFGIEDRPPVQETFAKSIRLFVVRVPSGQLTERQLLMLRPTSLAYNPNSQRMLKTTTKPIRARNPESVVGWQDFIPQARLRALDGITRWYDRQTFTQFKVSIEFDVQVALRSNVLHVLSETIGLNQMPKEFFICSGGHIKLQGEPDYLMMGGWSRVILAIEVKTKLDLPVGDIVEIYQENLKDLAEHRASSVSVIDHIKQIYGYMGHNKLQYGILSTYDRTWFLRRPEDSPGKLLISGVVTNTATDPTLFQCVAYIMSLARHNTNSPTPPPASPTPPADGGKPPADDGRPPSQKGESDSNGNSKEEPRLEDFDWDSFDVIGILGGGRCGEVFRAVLRGEEVAYKLCDISKHPEHEEELFNEVETYRSLEQLQGRTIPKLKGAGYTAGGLMAIATEIAGSPIVVEELSDQERNEIDTALSGIHDHGVLHNDIRPENILIQRHHDRFEVRFIDFGYSKRVSRIGECRKERATLRRLLDLPPLAKNGQIKKPRLD